MAAILSAFDETQGARHRPAFEAPGRGLVAFREFPLDLAVGEGSPADPDHDPVEQVQLRDFEDVFQDAELLLVPGEHRDARCHRLVGDQEFIFHADLPDIGPASVREATLRGERPPPIYGGSTDAGGVPPRPESHDRHLPPTPPGCPIPRPESPRLPSPPTPPGWRAQGEEPGWKASEGTAASPSATSGFRGALLMPGHGPERQATRASSWITVNGQPSLVAQQDGVTVTVFAFDVARERIKHILGRAQPREAPPLDDELTRVSIPSGPLRADSRAKDQVNESPNRQDRRDPAHGGIGSPPAQADFRWHGDRRVPAPGHGGGHGWTRTRPGRPLGASGPWPAGSHPSRW